MPVPGDDVAGMEPLAAIPGEAPEAREARLITHINRHMTARDTAMRTFVTREVERLRQEGERMDLAITNLEHRVIAESRVRDEEHRKLDAEVREIPKQLIIIQDHILDTKKDIMSALRNGAVGPGAQVAEVAPSTPAPAPASPSPTLGTLILQSRPVQALVVAAAIFIVTLAVGVLAVALGRDRAADVTTSAVDKLPRYEISATALEPAPVDAPAPGEPPAPAE